MSLRTVRFSPYLLIFFLPVLVVTLLALGLSGGYFYQSWQDRREAGIDQAADLQKLKAVNRFNQDVAGIQHLVADTLSQANSGLLDEAGVYRIHTRIVDELAALEQRLMSLGSTNTDLNLREAQSDFLEYRKFIIQTTDLAAIDPAGAMRNAYEAANRYLFLSEHTRDFAQSVTENAALRAEVRDREFERVALRNAMIGIALVIVLMVAWGAMILRLIGKLSSLTTALNGLAGGDVNPGNLRQIREIGADNKSVALRDLASAVLAFHDTSMAYRKSRNVLNERMKELSCMFDVVRMTDGDDFQIPGMFDQIAARVPEAMRYPESAVAWIESGGQTFGRPAQGECLTAEFAGMDGQRSRITVAYAQRIDDREGIVFLDEERSLVDAIAVRLGAAIERRRIMLAERDRQALVNALIAEAPDAIEIVDASTLKFVQANASACRMLGYTALELQDMDVSLIQVMRTPQEHRELVRTLVGRGGGQFDSKRRCKDGRIIDVRISISVIRQHDHDYLVGMWRDVTEERKAAAEVRRLQLVIEQSPNSVLITDLDTSIEYVNDAFLRNTGYSRDEILGKSPRILSAGRTPPEVYRDMWEHLSSGQIWKGEFVNRTRDGREQIEAATIVPLRQEGGEVTHYAAIKEDITEKKQLLEDLERHRDHLEQLVATRTAELERAMSEQNALFDTAGAGIVLVQNRIIRRVNPRMDEMLGYPYGSQVGLPTRIWYPSDDEYEQVGRRVYDESRDNAIVVQEQELVRKDGSRFWARMSTRAVNAADPAAGMVGIFEDITDEKAVIEQMRQARHMAEQAAKVKSDFLANMSHEIRTPMNAIIGMAHLAMKTDMSPRQRDYLKKIQGAGQHLLGIINDILDQSKIEAGKMIIERVPFEMESVLENVAGLIAEKSAAKGLDLIIDVDPDVPGSLVGDPLRLGQILINYANNAIKFTEKGEISIHVGVQQVVDESVVLRFEVADTGIGISEEQRGRMFRSFEQADTSTTRKYGGTGLGLAISKQLAELLGGTVGVESEVGKGSRFWFTAKLGRGVQQVRHLVPNPDLRGRHVLVVDDNEYARDVMSDLLQRMSFDVMQAASGREAYAEVIRRAESGSPIDILFLDWKMPDWDGIETAMAIHTALGDRSPPMVLVTAFGREEALESAHAAGINDVLIKPVTWSPLFDMIMRKLGGVSQSSGIDLEPQLPSRELEAIAGARILLVEDNELNQQVATELLRDAGFEVEVAENGAVAVEMVERGTTDGQPFDIVLMDISMPVMDGFEATREIRRNSRFRDLPIVAMTANTLDAERTGISEAGMNDYVGKPIDPDQLWSVLCRWIPRRDQATRHVRFKSAQEPAQHNDAATESLESIAGLDVASGLARAMHRTALYQSLLRKFVEGQRDFAARLADAVACSDWKSAERYAHTLKGLCAQIGATRLRDLAQEIEQGFHRKDPPASLARWIDPLTAELESMIDAISRALPGVGMVTDAKIDQSALRQLIVSLGTQLASDDFASVDTFDGQADLLRQVFGDRFAAISAAVHGFDFAEALELLRAESSRLNVSI